MDYGLDHVYTLPTGNSVETIPNPFYIRSKLPSGLELPHFIRLKSTRSVHLRRNNRRNHQFGLKVFVSISRFLAMSETSLRPRPVVSKQASQSRSSTNNHEPGETPRSPSRPPSLSQRAISQTLTSTANLANLLPTGTLLAFQLLMPIFTNNGSCDSATRPMTLVLLLLLALSCFLACFTDSVKSSDGQVYYGFATFKGMFLFDFPDPTGSTLPDLSKYRIKFIDGVHAVLSVLVFGAVALRDKNVLNCFYPTPKHETQEVLSIAPVGIGLICSLLFVVFPTRRHGIGYPITLGK